MSDSAKKKFLGLLARIFSDGRIEPSERHELFDSLAKGELEPDETRAVLDDFVKTTWKIVVADGHVSDAERDKLRLIVRELGLPIQAVPAAWERELSPEDFEPDTRDH